MMSQKKSETEEQIFEAARRVFQDKGYDGARMQEIADEANINKSMLHYYYRSKDKLFQKVYQSEMSRFFPALFGVLDSRDPLDQKIEQMIDVYYSFLQDNPHMAQFVMLEMNLHPERFKKFIRSQDIHPPEIYRKQIQDEVKNSNLRDVNPTQLFISIVSLTIFPFVAKTMIQSIYKLDDEDFDKFLNERKAFLVPFILNGINYNK